jgi:hypothetical protein
MATLKKPDFEVYGNIKFELNPKLNGPRWELNIDKGYSGKYAKGWITDISSYFIRVVAYTPNGDEVKATFPNYLSSDYEDKQWQYPGYLEIMNAIPDCDCGHGNSSNLHWQFCSRGKHLNAV